MAYSVARRTREIGVRLALGAQRGTVLQMVLRDAAVLVGVGMAIGSRQRWRRRRCCSRCCTEPARAIRWCWREFAA